SCVTRQGFDGADVGSNQKIPVLQALWLYTVGAALSTGQEHVKGRLAPGFVADFVVLEQDPFSVRPTEISNIEITETWVGGRKVWDRSDSVEVVEGHHHH